MGKIYKSLDILKLISAICIVGLHCFQFNNYLYDYWFVCATRFGVPCFFIISAFLLFKQSPNWEKMKVFTKRIAKLYLFWLIVTAPLTIYLRLFANHNLSFAEKLLNFIHTSLFSVSFSGSWYLMALLQCSFIIYILKKYLPNSIILLISFIIYILPCIAASYNYLFDTEHIVTYFISTFTEIIFRPYHCFPAGLIYVAIGMFIADNYQKIMENISLWLSVILCISSIYLSITENQYIYEYSEGLRKASDSFFSLIPLATSLVIVALKTDETYSWEMNTTIIRQISTIIYFSQFTFIFVLARLQDHHILPISNFTLYMLVLLSTVCLTYILRNLKNKYPLLKYAF